MDAGNGGTEVGAGMRARTGYIVNGTSEMLSVGTAALEALGPFVASLEDADIAEIRVYENMPITALIADDGGFTLYAWSGEAWILEEVR